MPTAESSPSSLDRILVVRLGSLGDLVHTLPAVSAIRRASPRAEIDWLVEPPHREFLELVPVVSNVLASAITDPDEIRRRLVEQVTGTVRWRESVAYMASHGVSRFFEIGAGKVLSGLVKRIADGAVGISVGGPNDIAAARDALAAASA